MPTKMVALMFLSEWKLKRYVKDYSHSIKTPVACEGTISNYDHRRPQESKEDEKVMSTGGSNRPMMMSSNQTFSRVCYMWIYGKLFRLARKLSSGIRELTSLVLGGFQRIHSSEKERSNICKNTESTGLTYSGSFVIKIEDPALLEQSWQSEKSHIDEQDDAISSLSGGSSSHERANTYCDKPYFRNTSCNDPDDDDDDDDDSDDWSSSTLR